MVSTNWGVSVPNVPFSQGPTGTFTQNGTNGFSWSSSIPAVEAGDDPGIFVYATVNHGYFDKTTGEFVGQPITLASQVVADFNVTAGSRVVVEIVSTQDKDKKKKFYVTGTGATQRRVFNLPSDFGPVAMLTVVNNTPGAPVSVDVTLQGGLELIQPAIETPYNRKLFNNLPGSPEVFLSVGPSNTTASFLAYEQPFPGTNEFSVTSRVNTNGEYTAASFGWATNMYLDNSFTFAMSGT